MHKSTPPTFVTNYPSGKVDYFGRNLRLLSLDESEHIPPIRIGASGGIAALIVSTNRSFAKSKPSFAHYMKLAMFYNLTLVVLASGDCHKDDIIDYASNFPELSWLIVDGPFNEALLGHSFKTNTSIYASPAAHDLSTKRNFGLILSRYMKWQKVMFLDDDISFPKGYFQKLMNMTQHDNLLVASNTRDFPDLSVVTGAFQDIYGKKRLDTFLNSQALVVNIENQWLGFSPQIYCEDWMFMMPYILKNQKPVWAGSVKQNNYRRYKKQRASYEEAGDLLAEGVARLTMTLLSENHRFESYEKALQSLVKRADTVFWEREILHRAMFIRDMLAQIDGRSLHTYKLQRIKQSLQKSLNVLLGTEYQNGLQAPELAKWVRDWAADLAYWNAVTLTELVSSRPTIPEVLNHIGIKERTSYQLANRAKPENISKSDDAKAYRKDTLASLSNAQRTSSQVDGLQSTRKIQDYMHKNNLGMEDMIRIANRLRYDRPIHFLRANKPLATIVVLVRQFEEPDTFAERVKEVVEMNKRQLPIHCVIWIVPDNSSQSKPSLRLYREYLIARVMLETAGTNIRLLSCIGRVSSEQPIQAVNEEYTRVIALMYWKVSAINSNAHPMFVVNSRNEVLFNGTLMNFIDNKFSTTTTELPIALQKLRRSAQNKDVPFSDDLLSTEHVRSRLIVHHANRDSKFSMINRISKSTLAMRFALRRAKLSWLIIDDRHYSTEIHDSRAFDMLIYAQRVTAVLIPYNAEQRYALASVKLALDVLKQVNWQKGSHAEIMLIVYGPASNSELHRYRTSLIEAVEAYIELPESVFLMSTLIRDGSISRANLQPCEAIIRYEHWLENDMILPKITWIGPKSNHEYIPMQYHWYQRNVAGKLAMVNSNNRGDIDGPGPDLVQASLVFHFTSLLQSIY